MWRFSSVHENNNRGKIAGVSLKKQFFQSRSKIRGVLGPPVCMDTVTKLEFVAVEGPMEFDATRHPPVGINL
jgi:hypothetical protein